MVRRLLGHLLQFQRQLGSTTLTMSASSVKVKSPSVHNLVWIDMEMTGLDVQNDKILEIACIVTNKNLELLEPGIDIVIHQPEEVLGMMNDWCVINHGKSGLTQAVRNSRVGLSEAEEIVLEFVKKHCPPKGCPLAGNSVYMDRMFLANYMPRLNDYLHYRIVDVSTIKELCKRWNGAVFSRVPSKQLNHRALDDIGESIKELRFYRPYMFADKKP
ncbi:probable oligoribonuclease [Sabethes cyaneus]|uniref:probable oligoribonuclease n=1 Tax=Sabethes cyaneus TaxID=53552 RepID=UPI00237E60A3|nr:probable oligoribonuclease [Sabethes cyaneus]XP_053688702.1 probable oligoribonuclease [Sabethes cyaneus]